MFVFLVLLMLYPNDTLTGFAKVTKTCPCSCKVVLEAIKLKEKNGLLKVSIFGFLRVCYTNNPVQEQSLNPSLRLRNEG